MGVLRFIAFVGYTSNLSEGCRVCAPYFISIKRNIYMEQLATIKLKFLTIAKWTLSIVFLIMSFKALGAGSLIAFICFILILGIIFPPLTSIRNSSVPFLKKRRNKVTLLFILTVLGVFALSTSKQADSLKSEAKQHKPNSNIESNEDSIQYDANGNRIISGENRKSGQSSDAEKNIPGITPVDIYLNFEKRGFSLEKQITDDGSIFTNQLTTDGIEYTVSTYCEIGVNNITSIRLMAYRSDVQYNDVLDMKKFLKFGCSIPYDGSDIELINDFIEQNYYKKKSVITISGVEFTMNAPTEFIRTIYIERKNYKK